MVKGGGGKVARVGAGWVTFREVLLRFGGKVGQLSKR
jgi:hypothetical protein